MLLLISAINFIARNAIRHNIHRREAVPVNEGSTIESSKRVTFTAKGQNMIHCMACRVSHCAVYLIDF